LSLSRDRLDFYDSCGLNIRFVYFDA